MPLDKGYRLLQHFVAILPKLPHVKPLHSYVGPHHQKKVPSIALVRPSVHA